MDWWKCSPGALQLLVALYCSRSSAFRCGFLLLSHGGAATDALDEMALLQADSLANRCEVSPYITASGTGEPLFARVWIKYQILFTGSSLCRHKAVGASSPRSCARLTLEPPTRPRTDNDAGALRVSFITLRSSLQLTEYTWWHGPRKDTMAAQDTSACDNISEDDAFPGVPPYLIWKGAADRSLPILRGQIRSCLLFLSLIKNWLKWHPILVGVKWK